MHAYTKRKYLAYWQKRLNLETVSDLGGILPRVEAALREFEAEGRSGKYLMNYADAIKSFCRWCERRGYLDSDPLKLLERFDTTPRRTYRALTREELQKLFTVIPEERQLVYSLALATGLRRGELWSLRVSDLNLELQSINLRAEITKNRKPGLQPLPRWLMEQLRQAVRGKAPDAPLVRMPGNPTQRFYQDLETAGIPRFKVGEGGATFHSLRATFATLLMEEGADIKTAMTLMRHSTPDLTLNRYAKSRRERMLEITELVSVAARPADKTDSKCAISVHQIAGDFRSVGKVKGFMVEDKGFEPSTSALRTQRSPN